MSDVIASNRTYHVELKQGDFAFFQIDGSALMGKDKLNRGDIIIGRKLKLKNESSRHIRIKGFIFNANLIGNLNPMPFVVRKGELDERLLAILEAFESSFSMQTLFDDIEQLAPLVRDMLTEKSCGAAMHEVMKEEKSRGRIDLRLILINRYLRNNYMQPITLQMLADLIQCNPIYLSNTYSRVFNVSPLKFLQNFRMKKAKILLMDPNFSVGEVATRLGYISCSQFAELFKRYYQLTPTQYRNEQILNKLRREKGDSFNACCNGRIQSTGRTGSENV